ncbi:lipid IV(A) 3-deoxy-D-manno-octulosonic acid transferase [Thaumasiovibrio sp. DFM-14]|uniref:lipid IV(A) 3-deoxy-D-manno-octulosonic acid transferase n=1 Tax=Thaumasiovibrio sp. DFM-14 TaxID=3384792 RepID=UPI0039A1C546
MIVRGLYTLILACFSPILLWGLYRKKKGKPSIGKRWVEHFGKTPAVKGRPIWVHAVSVGEVLAAKSLVAEIQATYPDAPLLITTTTSTGAEQASRLPGQVIHRYMPVDFSWCVRGFLKAVSPRCLLIIETELWPNTLHQVKRAKIPVALVNGRLSVRSYQGYARLRALITPLLQRLDLILTVHKADAERFISLGAESQRTMVTGSIKFDSQPNPEAVAQGRTLRQRLGGEARQVWIAASTHQGEDEIILDAFLQLKQQVPSALLVLVPRHPERFHTVEQQVRQKGYSVTKKTEFKASVLAPHIDVFLGDTMGEMMPMLAASDVVFMGGSLLGAKVGGHNFIEPASLSLPIVTGSSYFNFADLAQQLIEADALTVCDTASDIATETANLLQVPSRRQAQGVAALHVVEQNRGAIQRTMLQLTYVIERNTDD